MGLLCGECALCSATRAAAVLQIASWSGAMRPSSRTDYPVMKTLQDASSDVRCIAFGEQLVATAGVDGKDGVLVKSLEEASGTVYSIAFCQDLLAAPGADGKVRIYDSAQECGDFS
eukprot:Skav236283  [mRNA]  locus=scaffold2529:13476:14142:+ [translate_table: standard]